MHQGHLNSDVSVDAPKVDIFGDKYIKGSKSTGQRSQQASVLNSLNTEEYKNSLKAANDDSSRWVAQDKNKDSKSSSIDSAGRPPMTSTKSSALGKPQLSRNTKER